MRRFATVSAMLILPVVLAAQGAGSPSGCTAVEHRQFDFWVGDWNVTVQGDQAGTNDVTLEEQGCVLHEHWAGSRGGTGQSFNFYDRVEGKWHQLWVDSGGNYLHLTGAYADGQMRFTGTAAGPDGKPQAQRLTFFRNADGTVRQLWETSADGRDPWQVAFDGLYRKKP
jgi:hypothetical protein